MGMVNQLDKAQGIFLRIVAFRFNMIGQDIKYVSFKLNVESLASKWFYNYVAFLHIFNEWQY